ncbi:MAG: xanthine dehydrogenase family protein subunit M [Gemmatimonadota bacterium]|nr:MAG: xanthine dehydrogenase family protein subunit M [Gemmatimonadota bacterium]
MIPAAFDYHRPASLADALSVLDELGWDAKLLAGGQSLIPAMRFRLAEPTAIVDLNGLAELERFEEADGYLHIGALVRHATIADSGLARERYPLLADAAAVIADPLVRNRGTVGGSLIHADPAGDWGSVMLAYRAELAVRRVDGDRIVPIDELFVTTFMTSLEPSELVTSVRIPAAGTGQGGAYEKLERKVGDFATVGVAAQIALAPDGTVGAVGIGLTAVGATNLRAAAAEQELLGSSADEAAIASAAARAAAESNPSADGRGSEEYKRDMVRVLTARALRRSVERARGTV